MSSEAYTPLVRIWKERLVADRDRLSESRRKALEVADTCARFLSDRYGVSKVYLFGSLGRSNGFHERSDIDLAVEGLPRKV